LTNYSHCRSCGNVTFTKHYHCMICGAPKVVVPDGERIYDATFAEKRERRQRARRQRGAILMIFLGAFIAAAIYAMWLIDHSHHRVLLP
jgi:predicted nucleic acid-binding Zn ribbon protein